MAKLILGIAGEMGAGKGALVRHVLQNHSGGAHKFSNAFRDILDRLYLNQSRENISKLSTILRQNFGEDLLAKGMYHDVISDEHDIVIVDGVRRLEDMAYLKDIPEFKLIYVEADEKTRFKRLVKRGENAGDSEKNFEQFMAESKLNPEIEIRNLKSHADFVIDNNGEYSELCNKLDEIIKQFIK